MFLGVSASVLDVQMTDVQRELFAAALIDVRMERFGGSRKAAYTAAKVNAATWTRAESGQTVKESSLAKIVATAFPSTRGDWRVLFTEDGALDVPADDIGPTTDAERLDIAFDLLAGISQRLDELGDRLADIEAQVGDARPRLAVAHEEDRSIEAEQGHPETP